MAFRDECALQNLRVGILSPGIARGEMTGCAVLGVRGELLIAFGRGPRRGLCSSNRLVTWNVWVK